MRGLQAVRENFRCQVGILFASKAFVQLIVNPMVGVWANKIGYVLPLLFGSAVLIISAFSEYGTYIYSSTGSPCVKLDCILFQFLLLERAIRCFSLQEVSMA